MMRSTRRMLLTTLCLLCAVWPATHVLADEAQAVQPASVRTSVGRLFYTPAQRRALEAAMLGNHDAAVTPMIQVAPTALRFDGVVRRSQGRVTAWVDGQQLDQQTESGHTRLRLDGDRLHVARESVDASLRAGQTITADGLIIGETRDPADRPGPVQRQP